MSKIRVSKISSSGTLKLQVSVINPQRLLNLLLNKNIPLKNVQYVDNYTVYITINVSDYEDFKEHAKRVNARYKIVDGDSTFKVLKRLKERKIILAFPLIFVIVMYLLSSRVWIINIKTQKHLAPFEVRSILKDLGVEAGIKKTNINVFKLQEEIMGKNENISWIKIRIDGSTLNVEVTEKKSPPAIERLQDSGDVVATKDGIITRLYSTTGTCIVKVGDTVKKGQVIIAGIQGKEENTYEVQAKGMVYAKTFYEEMQRVNYKMTKMVYTGNEEKDIYTTIGGKRIYLKKSVNNFKKYDRIEESDLFYTKVIYKEYTEEVIENDSDEMINTAIEELTKLIELKIDKNVTIIDKIIEKNLVTDGCDVRVIIVAEENIASENP